MINNLTRYINNVRRRYFKFLFKVTVWVTQKYITFGSERLSDILTFHIMLTCLFFMTGSIIAAITNPLLSIVSAAITFSYIVTLSNTFVYICFVSFEANNKLEEANSKLTKLP